MFRVLLLVMMSVEATAIQSLGGGIPLRSLVPVYDWPRDNISFVSLPVNYTQQQPTPATGPRIQTSEFTYNIFTFFPTRTI